MTELKWSEPRPLQIDSWATGLRSAHAYVREGKIHLEVADGANRWHAEFPAPWVQDTSGADE